MAALSDHHSAPPDMATGLNILQLPGDITTAQVKKVIDACEAKAAEINNPMNIAVLDAGMNLKGFLRMDGAWLGSIDIAQKKVRISQCPFPAPPETRMALTNDGAPLYPVVPLCARQAKTARCFNMDTRDIGPLCQPGQPLYNIEISYGGLITFGGGVLLKNPAGVVVGAVGVSGGSVEADHEVAVAAYSSGFDK